MMKLKYLFNNEDLALMCLENWAYDEASLELFKYFRISSNAVYPFKHEGKLLYLRFAPEEEKSLGSYQSEVQLMETLRASKIAVPKIIPSKNGLKVEAVKTPWGVYCALVFEGIVSDHGITLEDSEVDDERLFMLGAQLARIHDALGELNPETCGRDTFDDILGKVKTQFEADEADAPYLKVAQQLSGELPRMTRTKATYGLLHYDYELDNLILNKYDDLIYTIDFDDACYGWYDLDIMIAVENIFEESGYESYGHVEERFLEGYRSERNHIPLPQSQRLTLKRFEALYRYARIRRTTEEVWQNEPEWMTTLRSKLTHVSNQLSESLLKH